MLKALAQQIPGTAKSEVNRLIEFPSGGFAQVKSADKPESLRSEGLDGVIVDEAAHIRKFAEVWEQSLRPALSDRRGGAWFISTPKGFNDFWELFKRGDPESADYQADWRSFHFPTWDNPFIEPQEIADAQRDLPALVFRQEYGAEFVQLAGALFKREYFQITEELPSVGRWVRSWDLAASTKTSASYTVGARVGLMDNGTLVIADVIRGRWEWPDALRVIANTARADGPAVTQGVEDVGTQKGMYQLLLREPTLVDLSFVPVRPPADKITRASPWLARAEQGKLLMVRGAWNAAFVDECCAFPESTHDDQVDAVSGAVQMLGMAPGAPGVLAEAQEALTRPSKWGTVTGPRWKRREWR